MDLTKQPPRSPYDRLGVYMWLPRLIDKARAYKAGTLGDYHHMECPMNQRLVAFLGVDLDTLSDAIAQRPTDTAVLQWVETHAIPHREVVREMFNERFVRFKGQIPEQHRLFNEMKASLAPDQPVLGFFDLLDLDDGRPLRAPFAKAA